MFSIEEVKTYKTGLSDPIAAFGSCDDIGIKLNMLPSNQEITDVEWQKISTNFQWSTNNDEYAIITPQCNGPINFKVRMKNNCGWSDWKILTYDAENCTNNCNTNSTGNIISNNFIIYPVPADTTLYVKLKNQATGLLMNGDTLNIKLYTNTGWIIRNVNAVSTQTAIDVANLPTATYTLVITYNGITESHQIVIQ